MVGGGDQIYNDPLTREPEIAPWINETDVSKKIAAPFTDEMKFALDRFFFNACVPLSPSCAVDQRLEEHALMDVRATGTARGSAAARSASPSARSRCSICSTTTT